MAKKWKYLTIDELLHLTEPVWLFYKRWDGGELIPTAIKEVYNDDEDNPYSIRFFSENVQIIKGYGVYWWATDRKPDDRSLIQWGWKYAKAEKRELRSDKVHC